MRGHCNTHSPIQTGRQRDTSMQREFGHLVFRSKLCWSMIYNSNAHTPIMSIGSWYTIMHPGQGCAVVHEINCFCYLYICVCFIIIFFVCYFVAFHIVMMTLWIKKKSPAACRAVIYVLQYFLFIYFICMLALRLCCASLVSLAHK